MLNAFDLLHFVQRPARSSHIEEAVEVCFSCVCFAPRTCSTHRPHLRRHTTVYFTLRTYKSPPCLAFVRTTYKHKSESLRKGIRTENKKNYIQHHSDPLTTCICVLCTLGETHPTTSPRCSTVSSQPARPLINKIFQM